MSGVTAIPLGNQRPSATCRAEPSGAIRAIVPGAGSRPGKSNHDGNEGKDATTSLLPVASTARGLVRPPVRQPQTTIVPAWRLAERKTRQQRLWFAHVTSFRSGRLDHEDLASAH